MKTVLLLLALASSASLATADEAPRVTAVASKTEVGVGEVFSVELKAVGPPGTTWTFPEEAGNDTVELRTPPPPSPAPSAPTAVPGVHVYAATVFGLGDVELPAVTVTYRLPDGTQGVAASSPVKLRIASVLPKDPGQQQLADIREPQALTVGAAFWIAAGTVLLACTGLATWLVRRRRPAAAAAPAAAPRPADAEAREALDRLAGSGLLAGGELRAFYIALAEIAKRYLERRLAAPVLEMTSAEMVGFLRDHEHGRGLAAPMRDLSAAADQVKFARGSAQLAEAERHLAVVRQMIDSLEAHLRPAPPERAAGPAGIAATEGKAS
jgi:hypothetical protein